MKFLDENKSFRKANLFKLFKEISKQAPGSEIKK